MVKFRSLPFAFAGLVLAWGVSALTDQFWLAPEYFWQRSALIAVLFGMIAWGAIRLRNLWKRRFNA